MLLLRTQDKRNVVKKRCSQPFPVILQTMTLHFDVHWLVYLQTTALSWLLPISLGKVFFLAPLSQVSIGETGSIVVVIDALDESGPEPSRSHILLVLGSPTSGQTAFQLLPSNFRLFMTSRSLPDIQAVLSIAPHVKAVSLDDVPVAFTECDIHLHLLKGLEDIRKREVSQIAQKADGLFEWASLACEYIRPDTTGESVKERFSNATVHVSREGKSLLDNMYHTTLESIVSKRPTALVRSCSVMRQVLYTLEPLPINGPDAMC